MKIIKYTKYLSIILLSSLLIIFIITLNKSRCTVSNFLQVKKDISLGYAIYSCKSLYRIYVYENIKELTYNTFFELNFRKKREKKYGLKYPILKKEYFSKEQVNNELNQKKKIKGINQTDLNNYLVNLTKSEIDESKSWLRSHGGNKNLKFNNSKFNINKDNIKNLKLKWKYQTFDFKKNPNKWILNSEVNPVFIDNKIFFISADFQIVALDALNGNLIWKKSFIRDLNLVNRLNYTINARYFSQCSRLLKCQTHFFFLF